jgi:DNA modification methylase
MHCDKGMVEYLKASNLEFSEFFILNFKFSSPRGNNAYLNHILLSHERVGKFIKPRNLHDGFSSIIQIEYRGTLSEEILHKHQKAVKDIEKFVLHFSNMGMNVIDVFGGSGTTMIACEKLDRRCFMMEISEMYCSVILKRWELFTGSKAELISSAIAV